MNNQVINQIKLFKMDNDVKKMINQGVWYLYKVSSGKEPKAEFLLIADEKSFFLSKYGGLISKLPAHHKPNDVILEHSVYFKDLPFPKSLSNMSI